MPSEKFKKLLKDVAKLKEAKEICENAGYKVSNSVDESTGAESIINNIKSSFKLLSSDDPVFYGRALCSIIFYCTEGFDRFSEEYLEKHLKNPKNAHKHAQKLSKITDNLKNEISDLYDIVNYFVVDLS